MRHRCRPPSPHRVQDVLPLRDPLQILQVVVVSIPVLMVDHKSLVIAEKRLSDKPVDISHDPLSAVLGRQYSPAGNDIWSVLTVPTHEFHAAF